MNDKNRKGIDMWRYKDAGDYLRWARKGFEITAKGGKVKIYWSSEPVDAIGWRKEFILALHKRINAKVAEKTGRNYGSVQQDNFKRDKWEIEAFYHSRKPIYQFLSKATRQRLSHLLREREF